MLINGIRYYTLNTAYEIEFELDNNTLSINDKVVLRMDGKDIDTTAGRLLIYTITGIIINYELDSKNIGRFISEINQTYSNLEAARIIKELENVGLKYSTKSGISICVDDLSRGEKINEYMSLAKTEIEQSPEDEQKIWDKYLNKSVDHWIDTVDHNNSMYMMMKSGARVKPTQIRQMIVAKGLLTTMQHTLNKYAIETSLTDGLSSINYFNTCGPARQGLASNFFVVPISGYLERQLVDVCKELVITIEDCGTNTTINIPLDEALGRYDETGNLIDEKTIKLLSKSQDSIEVRSPTTCSHNEGLCQKCCGTDPSTKLQYWNLNTNIGVIAAQTISEKSTQLALRGKHCVMANDTFLDVNGREIKMKTAKKAVDNGHKIYVFSCSNDGDISVGKVKKVWQERWDDTYYKITFDNGKSIKVNNDHPIMLRNGEYKEAENIVVNDSVMPLYMDEKCEGTRYRGSKRRSVKSNNTGKYCPVFHLSADHEDSKNTYEKGMSRHHVDFNSYNDYPTNIMFVTKGEHINLHQLREKELISLKLKDDMFSTDETKRKIALHNQSEQRRQLTSDTIREYRKNNRDEWIQHSIKGGQATKNKRESDKEWAINIDKQTLLTKCKLAVERQVELEDYNVYSTPGAGHFSVHTVLKLHPELVPIDKGWYYPEAMLSREQQKANTVYRKVSQAVSNLGYELTEDNYNTVSYDMFRPRAAYRNYNSVMSVLNTIPTEHVKKRQVFNHNHKVTKVEKVVLDRKVPFYDLEVESEHHNYPLSAGVFVHNTSGSSTIEEFESKVTDGILKLYKMLGASGNAKMGSEETEVLTFKDIVTGEDYIEDVNNFRVELQNIISLSGDNINSSFLEVIIRGISDIVTVDGNTIIRSYSDYNMLDNIKIRGIFSTIKNYPSWIKSASHRGFKARIIEEVTNPSYTNTSLPSENTLKGYSKGV